MKLSAEERLERAILPPWYYGLSYKDFCRDVDIFYIIPFNYIIRWSKNIKHLWDKFRSRRGWMDKQILAVRSDATRKFLDLINEKIEERAQALLDQRLEDAVNEIAKEIKS